MEMKKVTSALRDYNFCSAGTVEMPVLKPVRKNCPAAILRAPARLELAANTGSASMRLYGTPVVPSTSSFA
jgi:hypothetical protein